jgi:hypothetical protein
MLNKVKAYALEKYAGDKESAAEFIDGFVETMVKKAATGDPSRAQQAFSAAASQLNKVTGSNTMKTIGKNVYDTVGKGIGGILVNMGVTGVGTAAAIVHNNNLHTKFLSALEKAISSNSIIRQYNKDKVRQYAETIFKFAPNVAADVNLLSSILANAIHGEGIDPMTIKTLTDLESRYRDMNQFTPKTYTSV